MTWSKWAALDVPSGCRTAAVYEFRMVDGDGTPVAIPRFLAVDDRGILSIGETGSMESRRKQFLCAIAKCYGHSEGNLLYYILLHSPLKQRFPNHRFEYRFRTEDDKPSAKAAEGPLIKAYIRTFGEAPPLNSSIPDRYGSWD